MSVYVTDYQEGVEYTEHLDGVPWYDLPKPRRWHRHWPQTRAFMCGMFIERCPCGASRGRHGRWWR